MTPTYLLHLSSLHSAAPGALDVIFGPDGDFEGAPRWKPPLWDGAWAHHLGSVPDPIDDLALDLRVPTVAARLAGLCAKALGESGEGWRIVYAGMTWMLTDGQAPMFCWDVLGHPRLNTPPHLPIVVGCPFASSAHFLAALTLALAPQIAVLGAARK